MFKNYLAIMLILFLTGCDLAEKGINMLKPSNDVIIPIELGKNLSYEVELVNRFTSSNYRIYLRTIFLEEPNTPDFELVKKLDYPYNITIKGYLLHDNKRVKLVFNEHLTNMKSPFNIYGGKPEYSAYISHLRLKPGKYQFIIQDNSVNIDFYSKIETFIKIGMDTTIQ